MKNMFKKSALALTVAAMSAGAFAGELVYTNSGLSTPTNGAGNHPIVLATEVFGSGSEATLIAAPDVTYEVDVTKDDIADTEIATVKFTLNKSAVFGENLSLIDNWAASNATLVFSFNAGADIVTVGGAGAPYVQSADFTIEVDSGGEIGDNTIVFKITNTSGAAANLDSVQIAQYRTRNLTSALQGSVATAQRTVSLAAEFRNEDTTVTDTQPAIVIFESQPVLTLRSDNVTNYEVVPGLRSRINVAADEELFTSAVGVAAASDFDETNDIDYVQLGELYVERTMKYAEFVAKENGAPFDWNGSDVFSMLIDAGANLDSYDELKLVPISGVEVCTDPGITDGLAGLTSTFELTGQDTADLGNGYLVCAIADGDKQIPETTKFEVSVNVDYFNPRYVPSESNTLDYGAILRNGCSVTLFNVPHKNAGDKAFIRLSNVSDNAGRVSVTGYDEAGNVLEEVDLSTVIPAHGTTVFHTDSSNSGGVYLGDVFPDYAALTSGRARVVLKGGFPACEALGLVRTPSGVLTNMTSTTYAGDDARFGEDKNGTSNTNN
jgi:hypothetical protein